MLAYGMLYNLTFTLLIPCEIDDWHVYIYNIISSGFISKFGAGLFLLIQVLILLDCTHNWNDSWVEKDEQKWYIEILYIILFPVLFYLPLCS
jgi:hypothetical protein